MSKSRLRSRKAAWAGKIPQAAAVVCRECGAPCLPHRVCPACGMYKGRQVVVKETKD
jgi:large subunit ribosomal protein L32